MMNRVNGDKMGPHTFRHSLFEGIHFVKLGCTYIKVQFSKEEPEKFKPCLLSHLSTLCQSLRKVGVLVRLSVLQSYKNCDKLV